MKLSIEPLSSSFNTSGLKPYYLLHSLFLFAEFYFARILVRSQKCVKNFCTEQEHHFFFIFYGSFFSYNFNFFFFFGFFKDNILQTIQTKYGTFSWISVSLRYVSFFFYINYHFFFLLAVSYYNYSEPCLTYNDT